MSVTMPVADEAVLARREEIVAALSAIVPGEGVIAAEHAMRPFESDGLTAYRALPMVVVLPETIAQVAAVLPTTSGCTRSSASGWARPCGPTSSRWTSFRTR
jgi:glycolate oxidase